MLVGRVRLGFACSGEYVSVSLFFFNDTATTDIYTLSLHDALPISGGASRSSRAGRPRSPRPSTSWPTTSSARIRAGSRSEEHTSELQSRQYIVCRLLLEKKQKKRSKSKTDRVARR